MGINESSALVTQHPPIINRMRQEPESSALYEKAYLSDTLKYLSMDIQHKCKIEAVENKTSEANQNLQKNDLKNHFPLSNCIALGVMANIPTAQSATAKEAKNVLLILRNESVLAMAIITNVLPVIEKNIIGKIKNENNTLDQKPY